MRIQSVFGLVLSLCFAFNCALGLTDTDIDDDDGGLTSGGGDGPGSGGFGGASSAGGSPGNGGDPSSSVSGSSSASNSNSSVSGSSSSSNSSSSVSSSSSSSASGSGGGGGGCPAPPVGLSGCAQCILQCDSIPWNASWSPSSGATYYLVEYQCQIQVNSYQTSSTAVDLCNQVGMCNNSACANGSGAVTVKACNTQCCSTPATIPDTPLACGGGVCC